MKTENPSTPLAVQGRESKRFLDSQMTLPFMKTNLNTSNSEYDPNLTNIKLLLGSYVKQ